MTKSYKEKAKSLGIGRGQLESGFVSEIAFIADFKEPMYLDRSKQAARKYRHKPMAEDLSKLKK